jgi:hypothetical protein
VDELCHYYISYNGEKLVYFPQNFKVSAYMNIYRSNFVFRSLRFEEWMNGVCTNRGAYETDIIAEATSSDIRFFISDVGNFNLRNTSVFEFGDQSMELILDRIIYYHETLEYESDVPIECQLFRNADTISGIRFTLPSPLRVIEFYGFVVEVGQPHRHPHQETKKQETAESIILDLKRKRKYEPDEIMDVAVRKFESVIEESSNTKANSYVESLKLFIEVYKLLQEESHSEGKTSMLLPKVYFFISLCNLKLCNIKQAYLVAKEGLKKVDEAINDSVFVNLPPHLLGAGDLKDLIDVVEKQYPFIVNGINNFTVNPCIIDTSIIDVIELNNLPNNEKLSIEELDKFLNEINSIQSSLQRLYDKNRNAKVLQAKQNIGVYKYPLLIGIRLLNKHSSEKDEQIEKDFKYQEFTDNLLGNIKNLCTTLNSESPFRIILKNDNITNPLLNIYNLILEELSKNDIDSMAKIDSIEDEYKTLLSNSVNDIVDSNSMNNSEPQNIGNKIPSVLRKILIFRSNEHQRYESGIPVMGLQKCLRTIQIEVNNEGCQGYNIEPGDGYILKIFNDDTQTSLMSAKPMRLHDHTENTIELRGYPLMALSPFGWQPVDYSSYSFVIYVNNGIISKCEMRMLDRDLVIEYRNSHDTDDQLFINKE